MLRGTEHAFRLLRPGEGIRPRQQVALRNRIPGYGR